MVYPQITAFYAGLFGILFVALSVHVVVIRGKTGIVHGDGGVEALNRAIRSHANFAEYVPLVLLLTALVETGGSAKGMIHLLMLVLFVARLMHPIGMRQPVGSVSQYAWRATSMTATWLVLLASAALSLRQGFA